MHKYDEDECYHWEIVSISGESKYDRPIFENVRRAEELHLSQEANRENVAAMVESCHDQLGKASRDNERKTKTECESYLSLDLNCPET